MTGRFKVSGHDVDAMQWIGRSKIASVYGQKCETLGTGNEDALYAALTFENGAIGSLDYSWARPDGLMQGFRSAFEIHRHALRRRARRFRPGAELRHRHRNDRWRHASLARDQWKDRWRLADEIALFVTATLAGAPYRQHYREAFDAIPVLDALAESARSGQPVPVLR